MWVPGTEPGHSVAETQGAYRRGGRADRRASIDVTAEHRATRALRRRDAILEAIAASAADMISVHELDTGRLRWISAGVRHLLGDEPEALIGTTPREWIAYDDPDAMVRRRAEGGRAGRPERSVQRVTRRDGTTTWVEVRPSQS